MHYKITITLVHYNSTFKIMINNNLKQLLSPWIKVTYSYKITGIEINSSSVKFGNLFCVLHTNTHTNNINIFHAINNGASIILYNTQNKEKHGQIKKNINNVPIIYFFKLLKIFPLILKKYYSFTKELTLIGVTGTNGKSTTTHIIAQWTNLLQKKIGIMGTLGHGIYNNKLIPTKNTTESSINIHKFLHKILLQNVKTSVMEISSHSIVQNRILGLPFKIAILTNITSDHLDYHHTLEKYIKAKWSFLFEYNINTFVINADDPTAKIWIKQLSRKNLIVITTKNNNDYTSFKKWIRVKKIVDKNHYTNIHFDSVWGNGILKSKLIGHFNVINFLLALATLLELKYPIEDLLNTCKNIKTICGRMEYFSSYNKPIVIVDYAHNQDALKNLLLTLRTKFKNKKIWCIFGCGGCRDKTKRAHMGMISEKIAYKTILTNDNPRNENPKKIIEDILDGCIDKKKNTYHLK